MFRKVLVPLDGSAFAEQALATAAAIARAARAEVDLVLVQDPVPFDGYADAPWNADLWKEQHAYVQAIAADLTSGASIPVTFGVPTGDPIDKICRRVADTGVNLVVMTSHGRTGLSRAWFGSVAEGVLRHANVPVLILRPADTTRRNVAEHLPRHILVPIDGSVQSAGILPAAAAFARCDNARVTLLRILQPTPLISVEFGI